MHKCHVLANTHPHTPSPLWAGDPHDDGELAARVTSSTAPPLPPVHYVTPPILCDGALNVCGIAGGHLWLCHAETRANLSIEERLQPALLLLFTAIQVQDLHVTYIESIKSRCMPAKRIMHTD